MGVLKFKNAEGNWEAIEYPGIVKTTEQSLSSNEQSQVRTNLGLETIDLVITYDDDTTQTYKIVKSEE